MDTDWGRLLNAAERKVNPKEFERWFRPLRPLEVSSSTVTVAVPNEFFLDYFSDKYLDFLRSELSTLFGSTPQVSLVLSSQPLFPVPLPSRPDPEPASAPPRPPTATSGS